MRANTHTRTHIGALKSHESPCSLSPSHHLPSVSSICGQVSSDFTGLLVFPGMLVWALRDGLAAHIIATDLLVKVDAQAFVQASNNDDLFWR